MSATADPHGLVEHWFRHEYGRLVAVLTRRIGFQHVEVVEDAVQSALMAALTAWTSQSVPRDPGAWIYRAAYNGAVGELRRDARRAAISAKSELYEAVSLPDEPMSADEIRDDLLRMLFVCCDEAIPRESRIVLALKTLCGFSTSEIAIRLFTSEDNVYKRLARARERLREASIDVETPPLEVASRLPAVRDVLYLLFNEGYLAVTPDRAIRIELCDEAIRLTTLLAEHPSGGDPETFALLALMHFHRARLSARVDEAGGLILLENQDRSSWDRDEIGRGATWLARSAAGATFSRFHAEAGIAAEHCFSPSFAETRWDAIVDLYETLERVFPSPLHRLNRALAVAELKGPVQGLEVLRGVVPPTWLAGSYLWEAVLSDLYRRAGESDRARMHAERATTLAPEGPIQQALRKRLTIPLTGAFS